MKQLQSRYEQACSGPLLSPRGMERWTKIVGSTRRNAYDVMARHLAVGFHEARFPFWFCDAVARAEKAGSCQNARTVLPSRQAAARAINRRLHLFRLDDVHCCGPRFALAICERSGRRRGGRLHSIMIRSRRVTP